MKFSAGSVVITAPIGVPLAGNGRADAASRGIHEMCIRDSIYAAVLDIPDIEAAFPKLSPLSSSSSSVNVWRTCSIAFG